MRDRIIKLQKDNIEVISDFRLWVKDPSIPLEERWTTFLWSKLGNCSERTSFGLNRDDSFLYDCPLYMYKYQSNHVEDMLEGLMDSEEFAMTDEEVVTFKEYCLDNFCSKMKFDW